MFRIGISISIAALLLLISGVARAEEGTSLYHTMEEKRNPDGGIELTDGVTVGALLEIEAFYSDQGEAEESDIVLATFQLDGSIEVIEGVAGRAVVLWEEDDTEPIDLDEAVASVGGMERFPLVVEVGKMYLPVGRFRSHFVSDPLVLELAETRETAAQLIGTAGPFEGIVGAFNGDVDEDNDDQIDDLYASLSVALNDWLDLGAYWLSDLGDSDGLEETILDARDAAGEDPDTPALPYSDVGAVGGYVTVHALDHLLELDVEVIGAIDDFNAGILGESKSSPLAWNVELAVHLEEHGVECGVKVEGSDDFPEFPKTQWGFAVAYAIHDWTTLAIEYLHGDFDEEADRDIAVAQLAFQL